MSYARVALLVLSLTPALPACQGTCVDDGAFGKQSLEACNNASATDTDTNGSTSNGMTTGATATTSAGVTSVGTVTSAGSESESATTGDVPLWCVDADGDGFGDPDQCVPGTPGQEPPPGQAANGDDCDDQSADTYPGAAENESETACMKDSDGDGWGDTSVGPGVMAGTDCDDGDDATFPGAAENESETACMTDADGDGWGSDAPKPGVMAGTDCDDGDDATFPGAAENESAEACMRDEDGDGWGDSRVPPGVTPGADCFDSNADLNPGDQLLYSVIDGGEVAKVDLMSGQVSTFAMVDISMLGGEWSVISAAISPEDGQVYVSNAAQARLARMDYCDGGAPVQFPPHGRSICGLIFDAEGALFGVDSGADELVRFDPATGTEISAVKITLNGVIVDVGSCGAAFDCGTGRVLITDGAQSRILSVDSMTGAATVAADIDQGSWGAVGQAYDPVNKNVLTSNGAKLFRIELDGSNMFTVETTMSMSLNDLDFGPTCQ